MPTRRSTGLAALNKRALKRERNKSSFSLYYCRRASGPGSAQSIQKTAKSAQLLSVNRPASVNRHLPTISQLTYRSCPVCTFFSSFFLHDASHSAFDAVFTAWSCLAEVTAE